VARHNATPVLRFEYMPFSLLICAKPQREAAIVDVQGTALQGMFLNLIRAVDPALSAKLHDDSAFRPYTLSPLGVVEPDGRFDGFRLPKQESLAAGTPCFFRATLLDDALFPTFARYFLERAEPSFRLGATEFTVTDVQVSPDAPTPFSRFTSYAELMREASQRQRRIVLRFLTPTAFRIGDADMLLPIPRLVFQSYKKRFEEFAQAEFAPDFDALIERFVSVAALSRLQTETIRAKRVPFSGFTGQVTFELLTAAPPEFVWQINLLADFAFFCGTGRKTAVGMGQTVRV